jgi:hypothetical protein
MIKANEVVTPSPTGPTKIVPCPTFFWYLPPISCARLIYRSGDAERTSWNVGLLQRDYMAL